MGKSNAIVGQSGGPTSVINASLAGVAAEAGKADAIGSVLGMRWGVEGFLEDLVIDLGKETPETLEALKATPSSALGSCRYKLKDEDLPRVLEKLKKYDVRYLFLIGGNDTMDTIHRVEAFARQDGYDLIGVGIPKTVDNDLYGTDHTPGFPSAARYVAMSVLQAGVLARDMQRVDQFTIFQTVGRDSGWLAAAGALAKHAEEDGPHLIYMPERAFDPEQFLANVEACQKQYGWVSILCGEGIVLSDGRPVSAATATDKFANVEFGAMGGASAAMVLHRMISDRFGFRGEFQVTESLSMCAADRATALDIEEAYQAGRRAVALAANGQSGVMVTLERKSNDPYTCGTGTIALSEAANRAKRMPDAYINEAGNFPSAAFLDYARPLVGALPEYAKLAGHLVRA